MIDYIHMKVKAGDGGKGAVAFRHEKYYPNGGPFGGDGGRGGNVYFAVDTNETTLIKLRYTKSVKAGNGENGKIKKMHGADGDDVTLHVPLGTIIRNAANGDLLADLTKPGQIAMIAKGGKGGLGNQHFATSRNSAPEYAQPGEIGESLELQIELRLLADAGLIGFPSVGKSTFLSVVSNAHPEIAEYPFTTKEPNIGVVELNDQRSFVLADMPGLIEGASEGRGMGFQFLRHIKRCRVLIHIIDMSSDQPGPVESYRAINKELEKYDPELLQKPQIVVANKMDSSNAQERLETFQRAYPDMKIFQASTFRHEGLDPILYKAMDLIEEVRKKENEKGNPEEVIVYRYEPKQPMFKIINLGNRRWKVESDNIDRLAEQVDFNKEEDTYQFSLTLRKMGVEKALFDAGARDGDQVIIGTYIMDYKS